MGTILKGATLVEFEPAAVEVADLRIESGRVVARGAGLPSRENDEVIELGGKLLMPGLVSAHHNLYGALARGMPLPAFVPADFEGRQKATTWRLQHALDLDAVEAAATAGALEALGAGTTTLFDLHASPRAVEGSLIRIARGVNEVGLRGALAWEVTDRWGAAVRHEALAECAAFAKKARGRFRGVVGAGASFTLSHDALEGLREAVRSSGAPLHLRLAEDPCDERLSFERYGMVPLARLQHHGLLGERTLVAHAVHLSWPELSQVISSGAWLVHAPRSNMHAQIGCAPAGKFGPRAALGTAEQGGDLFAELQAGVQRSTDAGQPLQPLRFLANGHRIASQVFGEPIGPLREGAVADLVVLDYRPSTPLNAETLAAHLVHGLGSRHVESVMIDGIWRLWARRPLSVNPEVSAERAREAAAAVWARMAEEAC